MSPSRGGNRRERSKKGATIIRRSIKKGHGGHHGGAWKVAFADFTLAMMALFMTLWIVNSVSEKDRKTIVAALNDESIFSGNGVMPLNNLGKIAVLEAGATRKAIPSKAQEPTEPSAVKDKKDSAQTVDVARAQKAKNANDKRVALRDKSARELGELATVINSIAEQSHMQSNLEMEIVPQGLRILIKDDLNRNMFERGSAKIMPFFKKLLVELAPVFDTLDNKLIITGHTDAMQYRDGENYNNWNLSGDRALSARRVLEQAGMPVDKVMQVSAMSDRMLLNAGDPNSAENRRIEIMVLTKSASDTLYQFFGEKGEKIVKPAVARVESTAQHRVTH
ncbi:putative lateral flagellar export/assembly protein LafU [Siccibacter turicensis]|uniref:Putative lateral flagellar export/assembly protein LafU n=1 Tax=Siccibacter turicensis TaxID=357233 RepID=A0A2P8VJX7_9ENTR|nr:putative lateral flagellar export/assembly protein LafU [Siccibacter turicensis]PSN07842.1 putative lateral flagellar export/assembly protein LafU [Siccibacter turicensis]